MVEERVRYPLDHLHPAPAAVEASDPLIVHRRGLAFCQVLARRDCAQDVAARLGIGDRPGIATSGDGFTALPLAPRQWLLTAAQGRDGEFTSRIGARIEGVGYASEQSHGRAVFRISGAHAAAVLAKECRLDLHADAAPPGFVAHTSMAGIAVLIHRVDAVAGYDLILYPGYAEAFLGWLRHAAAEFNPGFTEETAA